MNRTRRSLAAALAATAVVVAGPAPARAAEPEQIVNGTFDNGLTAPWWTTPNLTAAVVDGRLCVDVPGGTINAWDAIIGQDDVALVAGETYAFSFFGIATPATPVRALIQLPVDPWTQYLAQVPVVNVSGDTYTYTFTSPVDLPNAQVAFQVGGSQEPWRLCLDDVSLTGGAVEEPYEPETGPRVKVNQVGYLPAGPKNATLVTEATDPVEWTLRSAAGDAVASGQSAPRGEDGSSGLNVHSIDFGAYRTAGRGFTLVADGETSHPFDIAADLYGTLATDALKFYYTQRSGIEISDELRPGYGRPAGHVQVPPNQGDIEVPCQPGVCDYTLDVSGGWYDAGDHGKYVVNGGISVHQLMSEFERAPALHGDGALSLPESGNGVPDILDEARWEQEFLLSMQVPAGEERAGMAHHKIHDAAWTGLPLLPHLDPQPRELHAPSTAATLNLAATAAQAARVFAGYDDEFAARNLAAARTAWAAAVANPAIYAPASDGIGGGAYSDDNVTDEFYWAAAELYITTGEQAFQDYLLASPTHTADIWDERGFSWGSTAQLGRIDLATVPNALPDRDRVRASVLAGAEKYLAIQAGSAFGLTYDPANHRFDWGSNSGVLNNAIVLAVAYDLSGDPRFRDGALQGLDYVLGRNALGQSYVTGYGEQDSRNQHSRWYARQLNPDLPNPPPGTLAGGPNSDIQDPVAQRLLAGCAAQFCYVDDIESWATNELTINWNAPLAWMTAFASAVQQDCTVAFRRHGAWPGGFTAQVTVTNRGTAAIGGWRLGWDLPDGQTVDRAWNAQVTQKGTSVTATAYPWNSAIRPGAAVTFGFNGKGTGAAPTLFRLNGTVCG
ncbi:glycoside hydrolase family 9 protein [Catenuloplanes atrovinosus]|uniref:Endoglucanase n=1 Tax=Catenuloplanes atrovinosus TaxID=137266 RepID=A0AAE4CCV6_9ACTN|nr:glycoside hydrolase family 9 protein [Catenuloplanes atrovinosus]MDR7279553.1 endoglucanase [Catenuloplanes atrovinosus]